MSAFTNVTYMNSVKLAMHAVLIETALRHSAGYAVVDFMIHLSPSFYASMPLFRFFIKRD